MNLVNLFTYRKPDIPLDFKRKTPGLSAFVGMVQGNDKEKFHSLQEKLIKYVMDNCKKGRSLTHLLKKY